MKCFLIKDPLHRLQNLDTIKQHPFFGGVRAVVSGGLGGCQGVLVSGGGTSNAFQHYSSSLARSTCSLMGYRLWALPAGPVA